MCIIFGVAGIVYVRQKMTPKQDGSEEKKSETIAESSQGDTTAPST